MKFSLWDPHTCTSEYSIFPESEILQFLAAIVITVCEDMPYFGRGKNIQENVTSIKKPPYWAITLVKKPLKKKEPIHYTSYCLLISRFRSVAEKQSDCDPGVCKHAFPPSYIRFFFYRFVCPTPSPNPFCECGINFVVLGLSWWFFLTLFNDFWLSLLSLTIYLQPHKFFFLFIYIWSSKQQPSCHNIGPLTQATSESFETLSGNVLISNRDQVYRFHQCSAHFRSNFCIRMRISHLQIFRYPVIFLAIQITI